jgi:hypothetical protein
MLKNPPAAVNIQIIRIAAISLKVVIPYPANTCLVIQAENTGGLLPGT